MENSKCPTWVLDIERNTELKEEALGATFTNLDEGPIRSSKNIKSRIRSSSEGHVSGD